MSIPETLTVAQMAPRLRPMPTDEMRRRFEIDASVSIADAIKHIAKERITFACVVSADEGNRVIGAMSERDALKYAVRASSSAFFSGRDASMEPVTKAMSSAERMLSVTPQTPVWQALAMIQHKIWRHVPVLDHDERLQSILDIRDLLLELDGGRTDVERPGTHLRSVWHGQRVADVLRTKRRDAVVEGTTLELYLRTRAARHTIHSNESLGRACQQMAKERLTFLVVLEDAPQSADNPNATLAPPSPFERNRVAGLVNERDFVRFAAERDGLVNDAMDAVRVREIMTPLHSVQRVGLTENVSACVDLLFSRNMRHLPVIEGGHLFGVLSLRDILRPLLPEKSPGSVLGGAEHNISSSAFRGGTSAGG